jgi:adenine deaminase
MSKKHLTRLDIFANMEEVFKFWEFAKARGLTSKSTREEMAAALAAYKKADMIIEGHKEHVEARIAKELKAPIIEFKKESK